MRRAKRQFTPEQKANIVNQIDTDRKSGIKFDDAVAKQDIFGSQYTKWKRQLDVGIKSSLRNGKSPVDAEKKKLMSDIKAIRRRIKRKKAVSATGCSGLAGLFA